MIDVLYCFPLRTRKPFSHLFLTGLRLSAAGMNCVQRVQSFRSCNSAESQIAWLQEFSESFNLAVMETIFGLKHATFAQEDAVSGSSVLDVDSASWVNADLFVAYFHAACAQPLLPRAKTHEESILQRDVIRLIHCITEELYAHDALATETMLEMICQELMTVGWWAGGPQLEQGSDAYLHLAVHLNHLLMLSALVQPCLSFVEVTTTPLTAETKANQLTDIIQILFDFLLGILERSAKVFWEDAFLRSLSASHAQSARFARGNRYAREKKRAREFKTSAFENTANPTDVDATDSLLDKQRRSVSHRMMKSCAASVGELHVCDDLRTLMNMRSELASLKSCAFPLNQVVQSPPRQIPVDGEDDEYRRLVRLDDATSEIRPITYFKLVHLIERDSSSVVSTLLACGSRLAIDVLRHLLTDRQTGNPTMSHCESDWLAFMSSTEEALTYVAMVVVTKAAVRGGSQCSLDDEQLLDTVLEGLQLIAVEYGAVVSEMLGVPVSLAALPLDDAEAGSTSTPPDAPKCAFVLRSAEILSLLIGTSPLPWRRVNWMLALFCKYLQPFQKSWGAVTLDAIRGLLPVISRLTEILASEFSFEYPVGPDSSSESSTHATLHYILEVLDDFSQYPHLPPLARSVISQLVLANVPFVNLVQTYSSIILGSVSIGNETEKTNQFTWAMPAGSSTFSWPSNFSRTRHAVRLVEHIRCVSLLHLETVRPPVSPIGPAPQFPFADQTPALLRMLDPRRGVALQCLRNSNCVPLQMAVVSLVDQHLSHPSRSLQLFSPHQPGTAQSFVRFFYLEFLRRYFAKTFAQGVCVAATILSCLRGLVQLSEDARKEAILLGLVETLAHEMDLESSHANRFLMEKRRTEAFLVAQVADVHVRSAAREAPAFLASTVVAPVARPKIPKLSLAGVAPPIYFTSNGDTAEAVSSIILSNQGGKVLAHPSMPAAVKVIADTTAMTTATEKFVTFRYTESADTKQWKGILTEKRRTADNRTEHNGQQSFSSLIEVLDRGLYPSDILEDEGKFVSIIRETRRIYRDRSIHIEAILLLACSLLTPPGVIDVALAAPHACHSSRGSMNIVHILQSHLSHLSNAGVGDAVLRQAATTRHRPLQLFVTLLVPDQSFRHRYVRKDRIGKGAFGAVFSCFLSANEFDQVTAGESRLAMKIVPIPTSLMDRATAVDVHNEVIAMANCRDVPGVCQFFEIGNTGDEYVIVMRRYTTTVAQWCTMLRQRLGDGKRPLSPVPISPLVLLLELFLQAVEVTTRLHQRGVAHLDIKGENLFLDMYESDMVAPAQGTVVIGDFGSSLCFDVATGRQNYLGDDEDKAFLQRGLAQLPPPLGRGTECVRSPELFFPQKYVVSEQGRNFFAAPFLADVWSLGCLLYEMIVGEHLFAHDDPAAMIHNICSEAPILGDSRLSSLRCSTIFADDPVKKSVEMEVVLGIVRMACCRDPFTRPHAFELQSFVNEQVSALRVDNDCNSPATRLQAGTPSTSSVLLIAAVRAVDEVSIREATPGLAESPVENCAVASTFSLTNSVYWLDWDIALQKTRFNDASDASFETIFDDLLFCSVSQPSVLDLARAQVTHVLAFGPLDASPIPSHCESISLFHGICELHPQVKSAGTPIDGPISTSNAEAAFAAAVLDAVKFMQCSKMSHGRCVVLPFVVDTIDVAVVLVLAYLHVTYGISVSTAAGELRLRRPQPSATPESVITGRDGKRPYVSEIAMTIALVSAWDRPSEARLPVTSRSRRYAQCLCGRCVFSLPSTEGGTSTDLTIGCQTESATDFTETASSPESQHTKAVLTAFLHNVAALHSDATSDNLFPHQAMRVNRITRPTRLWEDDLVPSRWDRLRDPETGSVSFVCRVCGMPTHIAYEDDGGTIVSLCALRPPLRALPEGVEAFGVDHRVNSWISLSQSN